MKPLKMLLFLFAVTSVLIACESGEDMAGDESEDQGSKEPTLEAEIIYGEEVFTFSLSGEELTDNVVFLSNQMYFKASNEFNQAINIAIAAPDLFSKTAGVFQAIPVLPYAIEDKLASIQFYDPTEQPLTNASSKYAIDDEVVVSEFTEEKIVMAYDGDAITGAQLDKTEKDPFNFTLELTYTDFQLTDMR